MQLLPVMLDGLGRGAAVFLDPPYTGQSGKQAGSRLYAHSSIDHAALFEMLAGTEANFLLTYDASPEIIELVREHDFDAVCLAMKNGHHNLMSEIVITRQPLFAPGIAEVPT